MALSRTIPASLLDLVGSTPLVELPRLSPKPGVRLLAKLEGQNPSGSIKDRVAKAMLDAGEASGELVPGRRLLEPTSGNTGIALALAARLRGYPLTCVVPANVTEERRRLLALLRRRDRRLARARRARTAPCGSPSSSPSAIRRLYMPFQYANEANPRAHYEGTGAEIADALDRVDVLVAGLGTGGTLMGAGERLRETFPDVVVAAAEPLPGDEVMGLRSLEDGYVPPILDVSKLDRKLLVTNAEAVGGTPAAPRARGRVRRRLLGRRDPRRTSAARTSSTKASSSACSPTAGWKYLSADFWTADDVERSMERSVWW